MTIAEEIKELDKVEPIDHGVIAKPHTPVYKMHRFFARRPYSVFNELIRHYSNPGSIVLDPMCGGGVTIIEGLRLKRKVIGVDLDSMATFITKMEAIDIDLDEFKQAFWEVSDKVKNDITSLYLTKCPKCNREVPADWFEYSNVYVCPNCNRKVTIAQAKRMRQGNYQCTECGREFKTGQAERVQDALLRIRIKCTECGFAGDKSPDNTDLQRITDVEKEFQRRDSLGELSYPMDIMPDNFDMRRPYNLMYKSFSDFFTRRNLLALGLLHSNICQAKDEKIRKLMLTVFSSTLDWCSRISRVVQGAAREITTATYWIPTLPAENNVWNSFIKRYTATFKGKEDSATTIGRYFSEATSFEDLNNTATCWLLNKSATDLREIPDASIDAIITDPPYGGNVMYSELSNFWAVWLRDVLGLKEGQLIDNTEEAIVNKHQHKGIKEYRELIYRIFKECHRVLKPNRYMVMTFHNREFKIWSAIHLAAHDAGFVWSERDGMIYQPPIQAYITTLYLKRAGAMQGDFILSYRKAEAPPKERWIEEAEIGNKIKDIAGQAIDYHGGAKLSTIYTRLMPFLLNSALLEKMTDRDLEPYLRKYFVKKDDKWYFPEVEAGKVPETEVEYYAPVETRVESIIRRFLYAKHRVTMDGILQVVYSRLINSNAAEYEEIVHVLNRICFKIAGEGGNALYQLKEERDRELLFKLPKEKVEEYRYSEESDHDTIIEQLARIGKNRDYESHIGLTEQNKDKNFRELSIPMGSNVQFGLDQIAFNRIREIDLLWIKGISIMAAFEVEVSTSIDSGITRFRELFAATPVLNIPAYIIIPDKREKEARNKIGSLANRREGITARVKYILFSDILGKEDVNIAKVAKGVN